MRLTILSSLLFPLLASALGNPFGSLGGYNPYPVGVNEDCSHKYQDGSQRAGGLNGATYDKTCNYIRMSKPIEVGPQCHYDDYTPTKQYQDQAYNQNLILRYEAIDKEVSQGLQYNLVNPARLENFFSQNYQNPIGNLEYELLTGKICQKAVPQNVQNAFEPQVDVPAKIISLWDEEYIKSSWRRDLRILSLKNPETDFQTLIELNLKGHQLWTQMVECAGGDHDLARTFYYKAEFSCEKGKELKSEARNYIQSVRSYLATSFIKPIDVRNVTKYDFVNSIVRGKALVQANYESFPTFHPLFYQAFLQILVDVYPIASREPVKLEFVLKKLNITPERPDSTLLQAIGQFESYQPGGLAPFGLWPSANWAAYGWIQNTRIRIAHEVIGSVLTVQQFEGLAVGAFKRLPEFYFQNRQKLAEEVRKINQRYGL